MKTTENTVKLGTAVNYAGRKFYACDDSANGFVRLVSANLFDPTDSDTRVLFRTAAVNSVEIRND